MTNIQSCLFRWKLVLLIAVLLPSFVISQSNEGTEFWFAFMEHVDVGQNQKVVMITSKYDTKGIIEIPNRGFKVEFNVKANDVELITLPQYAEITEFEEISTLGVLVTSEDPVSVYIHQYLARRAEASLVLPSKVLGKEYFTMSYRGFTSQGQDYSSQFVIIATQDDTNIEITLNSGTKKGRKSGDKINVTLERGQTYMVQGLVPSDDLTGSFITSDKKVAVFSGNNWTTVPDDCGTWDNLIETMYPIDTWGKQFILVPTLNTSFDVYRILASEANTVVDLGNGQTVNLNRGDYEEFRFSNSMYLKSNKPIMVAQFLTGSRCSGYPIGDPSMLLLSSIEQTKDTVTLYNSPLQAIDENYIHLILRTADIEGTTMDGSPILGNWSAPTEVQNSEFSFFRLMVPSGSHTIINQGCGVIASAYGYGFAESYAYAGGANFNTINAAPIIDGACLNDTVTFDSRLDSFRYDITWDFGDGTITPVHKPEHIYTELGEYKVKVKIFDECLSTLDSMEKVISISLRRDIIGPENQILCEFEELSLTAFDIDAAQYVWKLPDNSIAGGQTLNIEQAGLNLNGLVTVTGILSGCATFPDSTMIVVNPIPHPDLGNDTTYCPGDPTFILNPGDFDSYQWQNGNSSQEFEVKTPETISVTVTNEYNCENEDEAIVFEYCPTLIFMPNIFSPNGDQINDLLEVKGINLTKYEMTIFDRWGNQVTTGLEWDGKINGQNAEPGVYVYMINYDQATLEGGINAAVLTGTITLVR